MSGESSELLKGSQIAETDRQKQEYWDDLLALIDDEGVIPVIGADVLNVSQENRRIPLYRLVAEQLLARWNISITEPGAADSGDKDAAVLHPGSELSDAVWAISKKREKRLQELYRPVHDALKSVVGTYRDCILPPLRQLASIRTFNLFVSTTCDNLLATAINQERYRGQPATQEIEFAPNLPGDRRLDLPEHGYDRKAVVFYLFGKASASPIYAIHEEDMLEFAYRLQQGLGGVPEHLIGAIRTRNLLFVGCPLADWLGRLLVRISNQRRLLENRDKREFMVVDPNSSDQVLTTFFQRYSRDTWLYFSDAHTFIDELTMRWAERHPAAATKPEMRRGDAEPLKGAIFISYASEDYATAHQLFDELKDLAGESDIVFFDKRGGLQWGDEWKPKLMLAIRTCKLFVPLVSKTTQGRFEGVFIEEWKCAEDRDKAILGARFILPLIVDEETASTRQEDLRVPDVFTKKQIGRAIGGHLTDDLRDTLIEEIRNFRRSAT